MSAANTAAGNGGNILAGLLAKLSPADIAQSQAVLQPDANGAGVGGIFRPADVIIAISRYYINSVPKRALTKNMKALLVQPVSFFQHALSSDANTAIAGPQARDAGRAWDELGSAQQC